MIYSCKIQKGVTMKIAFIFDTILLKDEKNYYGMTLTYDFFKNRYLTMFDEIIVTTRVKEKHEFKGNASGYRITDGENVKVIPIDVYNNIPDAIFNKREISNQLKNTIKKVDKVIIRMPSILGILACKICKKEKKPYII